MENFDNLVARNILAMLALQSKKQSDLAKYLNLPRQTINKILAGKRNILANEFSKIAEFFDCDIKELISNNEQLNKGTVHAFFMGEISSEKTQKVLDKIFELSDIIIDQQYINDNKEG